jgi:hypothetical protein
MLAAWAGGKFFQESDDLLKEFLQGILALFEEGIGQNAFGYDPARGLGKEVEKDLQTCFSRLRDFEAIEHGNFGNVCDQRKDNRPCKRSHHHE